MASAVAAAELPDAATTPAMNALRVPSALLAIDQHRASVIDRIVREWSVPLEASGAGIDREQLRAMLQSLRADDLLAASLAGTLSGLRDVIAMAVGSAAPHRAVKAIQNLGDANQDLVYTPVSPCRLFDTRVSQGGQGTPTLEKTRSYGAIEPVTDQGGPGKCTAGSGAAVALIQIGTLTPSGSGILQGGPQGAASFPNALVLYQPGDQYGTAVAMPLNPANGQFDLVEQFATADLYGDLLGYFRAPVGATLAGNLTLVNSTASAGNIMKGANTFIHNFGSLNTFIGENAGNLAMTGGANTGVGGYALHGNTSGDLNTAIGSQALSSNSTGSRNSSTGTAALNWNVTGDNNTANGYAALYGAGSETPAGAFVIGVEYTIQSVGTTDFVAIGASANVVDTVFIATGAGSGTGTAASNTHNNTAIGYAALFLNVVGHDNIAIGALAGNAKGPSGSDNIYIGNEGVAAESGNIRIGTSLQTATQIAGIRGVTTGNANAIPVLIDSNGQLGTVSSSRRVKDDIADMDDASAALMKLRPVTFHYKADQNAAGTHAAVRADRRGSGRGLPGPGRAFRRRADRDGDVPVPAADAAQRIPEAAAHDPGAGAGREPLQGAARRTHRTRAEGRGAGGRRGGAEGGAGGSAAHAGERRCTIDENTLNTGPAPAGLFVCGRRPDPAAPA